MTEADRNVPPGFFVYHQGELLDVTHLFSGHQDCSDPQFATSFVAGPLPDGAWLHGKDCRLVLKVN